MKLRPILQRPGLANDDSKSKFVKHVGIMVATLICCVGLPANAAVVYVNANQTNSLADGISWATAFPKVQQGVDAAGNGDAVWVASAIYFENITNKSGVALYGGFTGTELNLDQRDWTTYPTILDGRQSNSVVRITAGTNSTRVDGFVLRNGNAVRGGGIYCANASPEIVNNVIIQNQARTDGGGIFCSSSSALIASNLIKGNIVSTNGFGGAGIGCDFSSVKIRGNRIIANSHQGTTVEATGGISCYLGQSPEVSGNLFLANSATSSSGSDRNGGGISMLSVTSPRIINNTIAWCQSASSTSGGINCRIGSATIVNNIVAFCSGGLSGVGGMTVRNNCVFGNGQNFTGLTDPNCVFGNATNYVRMTDLTGTNGNISADPLLVSANDFHLGMGSPCIDAGTNSVVSPDGRDLDGQTRIFGASVDIGADEFGSFQPFSLLLSVDTGQTLLKLISETGRSYVFEASSNFVNWTAFSTNQATNSLLELGDDFPEAATHRYYRARVVP